MRILIASFLLLLSLVSCSHISSTSEAEEVIVPLPHPTLATIK